MFGRLENSCLLSPHDDSTRSYVSLKNSNPPARPPSQLIGPEIRVSSIILRVGTHDDARGKNDTLTITICTTERTFSPPRILIQCEKKYVLRGRNTPTITGNQMSRESQ